MDPDYLALFSGDDAAAGVQAKALADAIARRRSAGTLGLITGDPAMAATGKQLSGDADKLEEGLLGAAQHRAQQQLLKQHYENEAQRLGLSLGQLGLKQSENVVTHDAAGNPIRLPKYGGPMGPVAGAMPGPAGAPSAASMLGMKPKDIENEFQKMSDAVSTVKGRGNLNKENQERLYRAERLGALVLGPNGDIQNLTPQQVREAATSLANLISGSGGAALGQIEELVPHTLAGQFANLKQKILNEPQGADAQAFLQNMMDTAAREKRVITSQIHAGQLQGLPAFSRLRKADRSRFDAVLKGAGLDPASVDDNGLPVAAPAAAGPVRIGTKEEYEKLPSGAEYIDPNGKHKRKR